MCHLPISRNTISYQFFILNGLGTTTDHSNWGKVLELKVYAHLAVLIKLQPASSEPSSVFTPIGSCISHIFNNFYIFRQYFFCNICELEGAGIFMYPQYVSITSCPLLISRNAIWDRTFISTAFSNKGTCVENICPPSTYMAQDRYRVGLGLSIMQNKCLNTITTFGALHHPSLEIACLFLWINNHCLESR